MARYFIKLVNHPCAISAGGFALLAHILLIAYLATATVGNSSSGTTGASVVSVSLQHDVVALHPLASSASVSVTKAVAVAEKDPVPSQASGDQSASALRGQRYFEARELTRKPLVAVDIPDNFALLVAKGPEQVAVLRLLISEYGDVDSALIEESVLPEDTKELLATTFQQMKFHPGELNGKTVKSQLMIAIRLGEEVTADIKDIGFR